jgi:hypothetical protein
LQKYFLIAPAGILTFVDAVEHAVGGLHSFMLLRHGQVAGGRNAH